MESVVVCGAEAADTERAVMKEFGELDMGRTKQLGDGETVAFYGNAEVVLEVLPCKETAVRWRAEKGSLFWKRSGMRLETAGEEIIEGFEAAFGDFIILHVDVQFLDSLWDTLYGRRPVRIPSHEAREAGMGEKRP